MGLALDSRPVEFTLTLGKMYIHYVYTELRHHENDEDL
jgi:hypothetical protein